MIKASEKILNYFNSIEKDLRIAYGIAERARSKNLDPVDYVEILLAENMAERVEGLISTVAPQIKGSGVSQRLQELEEKYSAGNWKIGMIIALEVAKEKFCKFKDKKEAIEVGLRVGLAYLTNGVVASPLEGFTRLELKKRKDNNKEYFCLYFSGPIRSAGTTAVCVFVAVADYVRKQLSYDEYDPTEEEIKRQIRELYDFHERVTNLQYLPSEEELDFMVRNLPVQINGDPSEKIEVSNYKDLDRVETNVLRNGVCLVLGEGLTQKAAKFWGRFSKDAKEMQMEHWDFLEKFIKIQKNLRAKGKLKSDEKISPDYNYIKDLVAGRPVLGYPLTKGGFRLRYGRTRVNGFSATSLHPTTMEVLNGYIASGTQLKMERPGKATVITPCDSIEGPIVKLNDGSVILLNDQNEAKKCLNHIDEILFLGDILINYGDFFNRAHKLVKPGYCEEWWFLEFEKAIQKKGIIELSELLGIDVEVIKNLFKGNLDIKARDAVIISKKLKIPLHPRYTYHWNDINIEEFKSLLNWIKYSDIIIVNNEIEKIIFPLNMEFDLGKPDPKRVLEILGIPHLVVLKESAVIEKDDAVAFAATLNLESKKNFDDLKFDKENVLEIVNKISEIKIKDKSGVFIGARMGRPEKAKMRKLTGSPHVLFPVGDEGGRLRCFQAAMELGKIKGDFPIYICECGNRSIFPVCELCNRITKRNYYCYGCGKEIDEKECFKHGKALLYKKQEIDIKKLFETSLRKLKLINYPDLIKGVRGTSNEDHFPENLCKGILRAMEDVYVNKDGTIRYDMTELGITHFKPKEIGTSVEKLKEFGYVKDANGNELINDEQIIEIFPQDVILPEDGFGLEEGADEILFRISKFVDNLLVKFYGLNSFYNLKNKEDTRGQLLLGLSPHTSAGVLCRVIGFSKLQGFVAHPLLHSIMRRDCLGYNEHIAVEENGRWKIDKIGDYINNLNPTKTVDAFGTLKKELVNVNTWSNPGKKEIKEITKHTPVKMLKLSLEDGRNITVTENHKLYLKGKEEKKTLEIQEGDKLIVTYKRNIEEVDIDEIFLPNLFCERDDVMIRGVRNYLSNFIKLSKHNNFNFRDSFPIKFVKKILEENGKSLKDLPDESKIGIKRDNISLPIRIRLEDDLLKVFGLYIAEGYLRKKDSNKTQKGFYQISISSLDEKLRKLIKEVFYKFFELSPSYIAEDQIVFSSRIICELFEDYLNMGTRASNKRIPPIFLNLKKEKLANLLSGYFEGDGSVSLSDIRVTCDTISEGLKYDLSFVLSRFNIFTKFYEYEKRPGPKVREFYIKKNRVIPTFKITKIIVPSNFVNKFKEIGFVSERKNEILRGICSKKPYGMKIDFDENYVYPKVIKIENIGEKESYCFNVPDEHNFFANDILVHNCDGDEACVVLLMDALLNFSRKLLPGHRGARQDAPLVLTIKLIPKEVDDMVFDMDVVWKYPLEFYEAAEEWKEPLDIKLEQLKDRLDTEKQYEGIGFTHSISDINLGVTCSAYKKLPTMQEKVYGQMDLANKIRAVDENDVARLVIERHFIRDIKGNLRKFSQQQFRCVKCNEKYRRPPLIGQCTKCGGRIIFTIAEGTIIKYMEPALSLADKYDIPVYLKQTLNLTQNMIESVFGRDPEKQEGLGRWF